MERQWHETFGGKMRDVLLIRERPRRRTAKAKARTLPDVVRTHPDDRVRAELLVSLGPEAAELRARFLAAREQLRLALVRRFMPG